MEVDRCELEGDVRPAGQQAHGASEPRRGDPRQDQAAIPVTIETNGITCGDAEFTRIIDRVIAIVDERRAATEAKAIVRQAVGEIV